MTFPLSGASKIATNARNHVGTPEEKAEKLGFKGVNGKTPAETRTLKDAILPGKWRINPKLLRSEEKIDLVKIFGGWETGNAEAFAEFLNTVIRTKDNADIRLLDIAARTHDEDFTHFLLENGADLDLCIVTTQDSLKKLAADVGFQAVGSITAQEIKDAVHALRDAAGSDRRIEILENLGNGSDAAIAAADDSSAAGFLGRLDLNAPIRKQAGKEHTLLDFISEIGDKQTALFLIRKGANQCSDQTRNTLSLEFNLVATEARLVATEARINALSVTGGNTTSLPSSVGPVTHVHNTYVNAADATQRSLGNYLRRLANPINLLAVIAGGSLYAVSISFNGLVSAGYIAAQGFASLAVMPLQATDKAISGGINLVRTGLGYDKMDTRYVLTKTIGGLACLTGLAAVAICANNPVSQAVRFAFISSAAYVGAKLISLGLEGDQADETIRDTLTNFNNDLKPDMEWEKENWSNLGTFIYKLATERGFKNNFESAFAVTKTDGSQTKPQYPGMIRGTLATFALRIYA